MSCFDPPLDVYEPVTPFDTMPLFVKVRIETHYQMHIPISPNKNDVIKRRHKLYPSQFEVK